MEQISSSTLHLQRAFAGMVSLFCVASGLASLPFPGLLILAVGVLFLAFSWRVLRKLSQVWMDDKGLIVKAKTKDISIPFQRIVSVRKVRFVRQPPVIVTYRDDAGASMELRFLPSMRKAGFFCTAQNMVELLEERAASTASA